MNTLALIQNIGCIEWIILGAVVLGIPLAFFAVYRAGKNAGRVEVLQRRERESNH